jgi:hypothetical protein
LFLIFAANLHDTARAKNNLKMRKISFLFIAFIILATASKAQVSVAPELGLNIASMAMKVTDLAGGSFTYKTGMKAGLALGAVADVRLARSIYFQPGLFYEMAGTTFTADYVHFGGQWALNTITVPLNFEYKTGNEGGNRFFVGFGPYVAYNFSGSYKTEANQTYNYGASTGNLTIGSTVGKDYLKALDLGLGVNLGYLLSNGLYVRVHYQLGLSNLCPFADEHDSYKTSAFGATAGYYLNNRKNKRNPGAGVK